MTASSGIDKQIGYLIITGVGVGACMQSINLNVQGAVTPQLIAMAIAGWSFSQLCGAVFGIAVNGTEFTITLTSKLSTFISSTELIEFVQNNPSEPQQAVLSGVLPESLLDPIIGAHTDFLALVFRAVVVAALVLFLAR
ncbi:hypothetical protein M427DRAFT_35898 [Gonapodya prolifera JEL478]|uniref:Uncharacterized protein n=1 Tax=Gonapodya prolifera (strain JEL478) TaxID=1344416 RepID=A0A139A3K5_GONPJ|nr:hypothetical protein M427DRAFT_35898 [Gonapodya prolifera JEL478]|eukprot:KXS11360.1 hypothetical protein M427DRAFT_35898 [Gonapodya prolifera JEL478]